ncbi:LysE family translocator [Taklimakanibacter lacteus]|uniref:LysE family translocator n=1 Tax=Taklimakanibacter lacteus TaxID=2268456 RepID=UPI000E662A92
MSEPGIIAAILGAVLIGAISPGPSFVMVLRTSIALSRADGLAAALGMGLGGAFFGTLALLGLTALLAQVDWLYMVLKLAGGAYLIYLAIRIWRGAGKALAIPETAAFRSTTLRRSFSMALMTQLSNPKTAVAYASVFAALLPPQVPAWMIMALPPSIFLVETSWYAVVSVAFSSQRPRALYVKAKAWIDRVTSLVIGGLGLRLLFETVRAHRLVS